MLDRIFGNLSPSSPPEALYRRVNALRILMPFAIVLVVVSYEFSVVQLGNRGGEFWAHLLFYSILGPFVTFYIITWIIEGIRMRQKAEIELRDLYAELKGANRRLDTVGQLIRSLAEAGDLEEVLDIAISGVVRATGAHSGLIALPGGIVRGVNFSGQLESGFEDWTDLFPQGALERFEDGLHRISLPLSWSDHTAGFLHLRHFEEPSPEGRSLMSALASEVGTALEAAQRRSRDLVSLYRVDQSIRAERNMDRLLERILSQMAERSGAEAQAVYLVDEDGTLRLVWGRDFVGEVFHGGVVSSFARRVALERKPLRTSGGSDDAIFREAVSQIGLPMLSEDKLEGVIVLAYRELAGRELAGRELAGRELAGREKSGLDNARLPLLALLANQATLAVRNARAYLYSEELAIGEERNRIAREIHDGVAQSLAFTALKLDLAERLVDKDPSKAVSEIQLSKQTLREQIREVRRSIFALRPIDLERFGLLETVRKYVQDFGEQNNLRTHLTLLGDIKLAPSDEAITFRILQESLNNVAKHAKASNVWVCLEGSAAGASLTVRDDGVGFDPNLAGRKVSSAGGLGLTQMRERMESRGGNYGLSSAVGAGTTVQASLPQN